MSAPALGDEFTAPWGRYVVHRVDGDRVVLRDTGRPTACVMPTLAALADNYQPVPPPCGVPMMHACGMCACNLR